MPRNFAKPSTSVDAVENESESLAILYDVLSVLSDTKATAKIAGNGFSDSIDLAIYQLRGVSPSTTASESSNVYPWVAVPKYQLVEKIASQAREAILLIENKGSDA